MVVALVGDGNWEKKEFRINGGASPLTTTAVDTPKLSSS